MTAPISISRKFTGASVLVAAMLLSLLPSALNATSTNTGVKCARLGSKRTVSGKTQECKKSGKSQFWFVVSVPTSVTTATPTTTKCTKAGTTRSLKGVRQECRKKNGKLFWHSLVVLKTPTTNSPDSTAPQTTIASPSSTTEPWTAAVTTTIDSTRCQLPDQRSPSLINAPRSLGFPLNQTGSKAIGTVNLAIIAADFPDFAGTTSELTKVMRQKDAFDEWLAFQSNGRLKANWQFPQKWYRLSQNASAYGIVGFTPSTHTAIVNEIITKADADVNYANVDEIFVYMPDTLTDSEPGRDPFAGVLPQFGGTDISTSEGTVKHLKASGTVSKQKQYGDISPTLWALWAHDLLHTIGVEGHNPVESFTLESEDYLNHVVSAWNQWLLGWMTTTQIACLDKTAVNNIEVDLVPLQSSAAGHRVAIVPLTDTRAIVVESHRNTGYAADLGASGVLVYLMDTKNVPPYAERDQTARIGSRFLDPNTVTAGSRARVGKGRNSALMLVGEYAQFENVRVSYVRAGTLDKIRFSITG